MIDWNLTKVIECGWTEVEWSDQCVFKSIFESLINVTKRKYNIG